jgi:hypothetical protein
MVYCVVMVGKGSVMVYCVVRVGKGLRNELCFNTAYSNCESKCGNVTSNEGRLSLKLFQNVQLAKTLSLILFPFPKNLVTFLIKFMSPGLLDSKKSI